MTPAPQSPLPPALHLQRTILRGYIERWKALAAWGGALDGVRVRLGTPDHDWLGTCRPAARLVNLHPRCEDLAEDLGTILHEYAHAACPDGEGHGERWREMFAWAVEEVVGRPVPGAAEADMDALDRLAVEAIRGWLRR